MFLTSQRLRSLSLYWISGLSQHIFQLRVVYLVKSPTRLSSVTVYMETMWRY